MSAPRQIISGRENLGKTIDESLILTNEHDIHGQITKMTFTLKLEISLTSLGSEDESENFDIPAEIEFVRINGVINLLKESVEEVIRESQAYIRLGKIKYVDPILVKLTEKIGVTLTDKTILEDIKTEISITDKKLVPRIGLDLKTCKAYIMKYRNKVPFFKAFSNNQLREETMIGYYMNCYLYILPQEVFSQVIKDLLIFIKTGDLRPFVLKPSDIKRLKDVKDEDVVVHAFFGICSISKKSSYDRSDINKNLKFIDEWIAKRITPFMIKVGLPDSTSTPDISCDILLLSRYLDNNITIRRAFYNPLFQDGHKDATALWLGFKAYALLILEFTGMTTLKLAKEFAEACETEAHTILEVVRESKVILKEWEKIENKSKDTGIHSCYYYIWHGQDSSWEINKYRHLVFCACSKRKTDSPSTSWDNYVVGVGETNVSKVILQQKTLIPLIASDTTTIGLSQEVLDYLQSRNKQVNPQTPSPPARLPQLKNLQ